MRCLLLLAALGLTACATPLEQIVLLGAEPGEELVVTTSQGTTTLTTPNATAQIFQGGRLELEMLSAAALLQHYGAVLGTVPEAALMFTFHFATGKVALNGDGRLTLAALLAEVQRRGTAEVQITGHTDQQGTDEVNDRLSLGRAEAVRTLLVNGGLTAQFIRVIGRGKREPVIDRPETAEARNRRVDVLIR